MSPTLTATLSRMLGEKLPNLLRVYPNPFVTQVCHGLGRYVGTTWPAAGDAFQTFLANGVDEAVGGAVKLARYDGSVAGRPTASARSPASPSPAAASRSCRG